MAKKKTSKGAEGFEVTKDDPVFDQMSKMNLLKPEDMSFHDFMEESNKITVGVLKAINGCHRNIVGNVLDIITEIYIRRAGE